MDGSRLVLGEEHRKKAAKESRALELTPRARKDAEAAHQDLRALVLGNDRSAVRCLEAGLDHRENLDPLLVQQVIAAVSSPEAPRSFDLATEAATLVLLPHAIGVARMHGAEEEARELVVDRWRAIAGLSFALEAYVASLRYHLGRELVHSGPLELRFGSAWLSPRPFERLTGWHAHLHFLKRYDEILGRHFVMAAPEEQRAARDTAERLRDGAALDVRTTLSAAILEPTWIDADLRARAAAEMPENLDTVMTNVTERSLVAASDPDAVGAFFAKLTVAEARHLSDLYVLASYPTSHRFAHAFLAKHREGAIEPLLDFVTRADVLLRSPALHQTHGSEEAVLRGVCGVLDALTAVHDSRRLAEIALRILRATQGVPKKMSPRPQATLCVLGSAAHALPLVEELAKADRNEDSWTWALLRQVKHAGGVDAKPLSAPVERTEPSLADALPTPSKRFSKPSFWSPGAFAPLRDKEGRAVTEEVVDRVGAILSAPDVASVAALKNVLDGAALSAFAVSVVEAWNQADAPTNGKWVMMALGRVGDDGAAERLGVLGRLWSEQGAYKRTLLAIDALAEIGSRNALREIHGTGEKTRYAPVKALARKRLADIARRLGMSDDDLADRLLPTLDLDRPDVTVLSYGSRRFGVDFDEYLTPVVVDDKGKIAKAVPKVAPGDDGALAAAAETMFKRLKKNAKDASRLVLGHLERAMRCHRSWAVRDFAESLLENPFVAHAVRRLVWIRGREGVQDLAFTVRTDASLVDAVGAPVDIQADDTVRLAHPVLLSDRDLAAWTEAFSKEGRKQPFEQLHRRRLARDGGELDALVRGLTNRVVPSGAVVGLLGRGWKRGQLFDAGIYQELEWHGPNAASATIHFSPGLPVAGAPHVAEQTVHQVLVRPANGSAAAAIASSELARDLEPLAILQP